MKITQKIRLRKKQMDIGEAESALSAGRKLMEAGAHDDAIRVLSQIALQYPERPDTWRMLQEIYRRQRRLEESALFGGIARAMAVAS